LIAGARLGRRFFLYGRLRAAVIGARRLFLGLYAASGAAALVYEVAWTRLLTLQLGHTVAAASTVLAALMAGLAVGAWLGGRWGTGCWGTGVDKTGTKLAPSALDDLRTYAVLEVVVAIAAILLPLALTAVVPILSWAYTDATTPIRFAIVRVIISVALVGVPGVAMGATFPIAARWIAGGTGIGKVSSKRERDPSPAWVGFLYAANTAGAAIGAAAAGFWLIPTLGLRATTWVGVALNAAAAAGAVWIARTTADDAKTSAAADVGAQAKPRHAPRPSRPLPPSSRPTSAIAMPRLATLAVALSGFTALVYEVVWTRLLALVIGPTTYAFATMAASFITGLAIGSAAGARLARRTDRPATWLSLTLIGGALAATLAGWIGASRMPLAVAAQVADPAATFDRVVLIQAVGAALLLLPMTLALGATFTLALAAAGTHAATVSHDTARVYAANTAAAIAGALVGGFVLVPRLGLRATIRDAAAATAIGGALALAAAIAAGGRSRRAAGTLAAAVGVPAVAAILLLPAWDRALLASGAYKYAPYVLHGPTSTAGDAGAIDLEAVLRAGTLDYYEDGAAATVSVRDLAGTRSLSIDGKVDASNGGDMLTQRLLGLLPVLLHGRAREICIIGLGSGVTLGSALAAGTVEHADVVEISPEVVEASHFFDAENGGALAHRGVRLIVGDGRSHLLLTPRRYDVIVSEPSNPWMSGVAALFTREFFEAARRRLAPDGLLCQWAHTYDIDAGDLRSIVRTFASVFPQGTLWLVGDGDLLLVGTSGAAIAPRLAALAAAAPAGSPAARALADVGIADGTAPFALLSLYAAGPREIERYASGAQIQTDDRTPLEYSAPRGIYGRTRDDNAAAIRGLQPDQPAAVREAFARATDADWASRGMMELKAQAFGAAYDAFHRAVTLNRGNVGALAGLSDAAGGSRQLPAEREWLEGLARREPANAPLRVELSRVRAVSGDPPGAIAAADEAIHLAPDDPRAAEQLASVLADAGDGDRLAPLADAMVSRFPDRLEPRYYRATALFLRGRTEDAIAAARQVVDTRPDHARAQNLLGAACAAVARRDCALAAFTASIRGNPHDASAYVNAGLISLQSLNGDAAVGYFASALAIDPSSAAARSGLVQARSLLAHQ
jgi:spermidine synthase